MPLVTLLTDFGEQDGFAAIMKGVMLSINPQLAFIDITHQIPQGDITAASFILKSAFHYFPENTIHVIVVDPGVGSARKILGVQIPNHIFVAPDNGVLQWIFATWPDANVFELNKKDFFLPNISNTFHGRDIFAPVAAHISTGITLEEIGSPCSNFNKGIIPVCKELGDIASGEIAHIDHFGNLITNIPEHVFFNKKLHSIHLAAHKIVKLANSYSDVLDGFPVALIGSHGMLEIAVRNGNAAECLNINNKARVIVQFQE